MSKSTFIDWKQGKSVLFFVVVCACLVGLLLLRWWPTLVIYSYAITALYVYLYFKSDWSKALQIYFYIGLVAVFIVGYGALYSDLKIIDTQNGEVATLKRDHYYFSAVTWTTLGYGDFRPSKDARVYAASQAVLGYLYMGILVAKLFHALGVRETKS